MQRFSVESTRKTEVIDITDRVQETLVTNGHTLCMVYCPHTTAAVAIGESEEDLNRDYERVIGQLLADIGPFDHSRRDNPNAEAHIFSTLQGCSILIPVQKAKLQLGQWQRVLLFEMDGPRERTLLITHYA